MAKFKPHQKITWSSQAAGSWIDKTGEVLDVLGPNVSIMERLRAMSIAFKPEFKKSHVQATDTTFSQRYLIEVVVVRRAGKNAKYKCYYAPLVSVIDGESQSAGRLASRA
jgi:hypothetical protein